MSGQIYKVRFHIEVEIETKKTKRDKKDKKGRDVRHFAFFAPFCLFCFPFHSHKEADCRNVCPDIGGLTENPRVALCGFAGDF
jgi:hypothetical protein